MNKRLFLYSSIVISAILLSAAAVRAELLDKIAIVVNNEIITDSEIQHAMAPIYAQYRTMYKGPDLVKKLEEARQRIVQQMIEDKLILSEAKKLNIEVEDKEIDARLDETIRHIGSKESFQRALAEQGIALKDVRARYREQLMTRKLIDQKVGAKVMITPLDVSDYYNKHKKELVQPEQVKVRSILIRLKQDEGAEKSLELAREMVRRCKEGSDFAALAKVYSEGSGAGEGGLMGYIKKGDLMPEVEKVIFNMKEGDISDVIQTPAGYYIFKVEEKRPGKEQSLSEARRGIEEAVYRAKVNEKLKGWIEGLKKDAYIAFK